MRSEPKRTLSKIMVDFNKVKMICSRLGLIMADAKGIMSEAMQTELSRLQIKDNLTQNQEWRLSDLQYRQDNYDPKKVSGSCESYLIPLYGYLRYGRRPQMKGDMPIQLIKGIKSEVRATEMVSRVTAQDLYRYKTKLNNSYLRGALDVLDAKEIEKSKIIVEVKNCSTLTSFLHAAKEPLPRKIFWQMQGYFAITGKENGIVYNCLVDMPDHVIAEQYDLLVKDLCPDGVITSLFEEEWAEKERGFRFNDIPEEERVMPFPIERDEKCIEKIYEKIDICREWLIKYDEIHKKRTYRIVLG
jgi:hypothetical protein